LDSNVARHQHFSEFFSGLLEAKALGGSDGARKKGMLSRAYALAFIAATLTVSSVSAATITATTSKENKTVVSLSGEIVEGDAGKLKDIIRSANEAARFVSVVRFNSPTRILIIVRLT
jgi:seryl-tRNA(Sec) selenium transferase